MLSVTNLARQAAHHVLRRSAQMTDNDLHEAARLVATLTQNQRLQLFRLLSREFPVHALEEKLNTSAEIILEAIARSSDLTLRGVRGVIAEAAFATDVLSRLPGWQNVEIQGNPSYDFLLRDSVGDVRIQVKLQRQVTQRPMWSEEAPRRCGLPAGLYVVETQRTRSGKTASGAKTRPYRFDEFDLLAVSLHPSMREWSTFAFTLCGWLVPDAVDPQCIQTYQAVPKVPDEYHWTSDLLKAVGWLRSGERRPLPFTRPS